nr:NADH dehydrogenase subunit 5 [Empoascanara gracilis]
MLKFNFYLYWGVIIFFLSLLFFYYFLLLLSFDLSVFLEWSVITVNSICFYYVLLFDWISVLFISVVLLISSMVIFYSVNYMGVHSYSSNRFLFLVLSFIFSMFLMIISPSLLSILLGWDGLGLVSYCLVIYYNSLKSYLAGLITCLTNRLGDIGLLVSIAWLSSFGSWHFLFYLDYYNNLIFYLVIMSSFTKSAQIPFSTWLPAAMSAPTPVSSLVHSSTLVTAGVYLLIRFFYQFVYNNLCLLFLSLITMLMSSFCANYEFDLKKIIALSTLSQLGLMMSSLFIGFSSMSYFHLISHAMFKSLLFLCAGIFIYYMNNNQDIRVMGSVCLMMPFTSACFNISNLALCGIPFLSGFYSKDAILESMLMSNLNLIFYMIFYLGLGLTCSYTIRLLYYSMLIFCSFGSQLIFFEDKVLMKVSIMVLTLLSIFFGCLVLWLLLIDTVSLILPTYLKLMPLLFVTMGLILGYELIEVKYFLFPVNFYFFMNMWFLYSYSYYLYLIFYSWAIGLSLNLNWGEFFGSQGISTLLFNWSNNIHYYLINNFKIILLSFFVWLFLLI